MSLPHLSQTHTSARSGNSLARSCFVFRLSASIRNRQPENLAYLPRRPHRLRRNILSPRPQPPNEPAADHQPERNQLRPGHRPAKDRPAPRIVSQIFQEEPRYAIDEQERAKYLPIELPALQQPHQEEEVRQLDRRLEQLRRLQRHVQRSAGNL